MKDLAVLGQKPKRKNRKKAKTSLRVTETRVRVVPVDALGRVHLLTTTKCKRNKLSLPGGRRKPGEGRRRTAGRELGEELGVPAKVGKCLGRVLQHEPDGTVVESICFAVKVKLHKASRPRLTKAEKAKGLETVVLKDLKAAKKALKAQRRALRKAHQKACKKALKRASYKKAVRPKLPRMSHCSLDRDLAFIRAAA